MTNLLALITPTNLDAEREKFFASSTYNPIFHYIWQDDMESPVLLPRSKQPLWEAIQSQDHEEIVSQASKYFEVPLDEANLTMANTHARTNGILSVGSAEEYAQLMRDGLDYFDLEEVRVVLSDQSGFNARPQHRDKIILVSRHIQFEYFSMEGGVHHELVHCLRYYNRHHNQIKRSTNYLPTEEGLAAWCQDNTNDDNGLAQHAMEYLASFIGVNGSLREVFECFVELGMSKELAWKRASRHKFGFIDTSRPGDILKPAMYYANEVKVAQLTTGERLRLFVGKIALDELADHPTYTGLWPAQKIIEYFKL
ncbi:hypothetical protein KBD75_00685 [Candidatus Woesebacteria bacterium]|nr:hypothetical protein [Candidatus Woesebacteria bacterium]